MELILKRIAKRDKIRLILASQTGFRYEKHWSFDVIQIIMSIFAMIFLVNKCQFADRRHEGSLHSQCHSAQWWSHQGVCELAGGAGGSRRAPVCGGARWRRNSPGFGETECAAVGVHVPSVELSACTHAEGETALSAKAVGAASRQCQGKQAGGGFPAEA